MSILEFFKNAFKQYGTWVGLIFTVAVAILANLDSTSQFTMSLVGMHYSVVHGLQHSRDGRVLYTMGGKDIFTILALHLPVYVICSVVWDLVAKYRPGPTKNQFCFYCTSALMLTSCFLLDVIGVFKEGFWTALPLWWNGLPHGHMSFYVKFYFLVQSTVLCYYLETLPFSGNYASMLDSWIDGPLNLVFSIICYLLNFLPLMMVIVPLRFCLQIGLSLVQVISLLELLGKRRDFARVVLHALRWITGCEIICYLGAILAIFIYGSRIMRDQLILLVPLVAMLVTSGVRVMNSRKYDLDLLRAADGTQAAGNAAPAPAAAPAAAPAPTKKKGKK